MISREDGKESAKNTSDFAAWRELFAPLREIFLATAPRRNDKIRVFANAEQRTGRTRVRRNEVDSSNAAGNKKGQPFSRP